MNSNYLFRQHAKRGHHSDSAFFARAVGFFLTGLMLLASFVMSAGSAAAQTKVPTEILLEQPSYSVAFNSQVQLRGWVISENGVPPTGQFRIYGPGDYTSNGINVRSGGEISANFTPGVSGLYRVVYAGNSTFETSEQSFDVVVAAPVMSITPASLPQGRAGASYSQNFNTTGGGTGPSYSYSLSGDPLPAGMNLSAGGNLSGIPTEVASLNFTVSVLLTTSSGAQYTHSVDHTLVINTPDIRITPATSSLTSGTYGTPYSIQLGVTGGVAPYQFGLTDGRLPAGLTLGSDGLISGTPVEGGDFTFTVNASDQTTGPSAPYSGSQQYTLRIADVAPVANDVSVTIDANSADTAISLDITEGTPLSVAVTPASNGTVSVSGITVTYRPDVDFFGQDSFTYTASNASGTSAPATVSIEVTAPPITMSPPSGILGPYLVGSDLSQTFTAFGGVGPYTFTIRDIPTGFSFDSSGVLTGEVSESVTMWIDVVDSRGATGVGAYNLIANQASAGVLLSLSPDLAVIGQDVALTATVTSSEAGVVPTGSVTFTAPSGLNQTVSLDGSGVASAVMTAAVSENVTAIYNGDSLHGTAPDIKPLEVNAAATTTSVLLSEASVQYGETVEVTANVTLDAPAVGIATGTVSFSTPSGFARTAALDTNGMANVTLPATVSETITATYSGSTNMAASSGSAALTVAHADTVTAISLDPDTATVADEVVVTARVTSSNPDAGIPTGTVSFSAPSGLSATVALDAGGNAQTVMTATATETVTARYDGDANFAVSDDSAALTVNDATTTTDLEANPNPATYGGTVSLSATVQASNGLVPMGSVTFTAPSGLSISAALVDGVATADMTAVNSERITASYDGAFGFAPSIGATDLAVDERLTSTSVTLSPDTALHGDTVTVTANVTADDNSVPTGLVTFAAPSGLSVQATLDASGSASALLDARTSETVTASYEGATGYAPSQGTADLTVEMADAAVTLQITPNPAKIGEPVTLEAVVSAANPSDGKPEGTITFTSPSGLNVSVAVDASGRAAAIHTAAVAETFTAAYQGDGRFDVASATSDLAIDAVETTTDLTTRPNPVTFGETVEMVAVVTAADTSVPAGQVRFTSTAGWSNTVALGPDATSVISITASSNETVTAVYEGNTSYLPSQDTADIAVDAIVTAVVVKANIEIASPGDDVTLTASVNTVPDGLGVPSGDVIFGGPEGFSRRVALDPSGTAETVVVATRASTWTATYEGNQTFLASSGETAVAVPSDNAFLTNLVPSVSALQPGFSSGVGNYVVDVEAKTESMSFTATAAEADARITMNGSRINSGSPSAPVALAVGKTTVDFVVTAPNGQTTRSYAVTVNRALDYRPDPSKDPEVIGLITAQADASVRFARNQMTNFNRRLERLHNEQERQAYSVDVNIALNQGNDRQDSAVRELEELLGNPAAAGVADDIVLSAYGDDAAPVTPASSLPKTHSPLAVWTGGFINFAEREGGGIEFGSTTVGMSAGMDYRFTDNFVAGFGVGYGRDRTEIGNNGTTSTGEAFSAAVYASYNPVDNLFIDGVLGVSKLDFASSRYVTADGSFANGNRGGSQVFGSVTAAYEFRQDNWLVSPYGRVEFSHSRLDGFSESGAGIHDLTFGKQTVDSLSGVIGIRASKDIRLNDRVVITPSLRAEYKHEFAGSSGIDVGYSDTMSLPYRVDVIPSRRRSATIGAAVDVAIDDNVDFGFDYRADFSGSDVSHRFGVKLTVRF